MQTSKQIINQSVEMKERGSIAGPQTDTVVVIVGIGILNP